MSFLGPPYPSLLHPLLANHHLLPLLLLLAGNVVEVQPHARLMEPPSRASMWRLGFDNPPDFNDHQGFCGGFKHQYGVMGGRCGICGDPADAWPRQHEAPGGRFANGLITRQYKPGQDIVVKVDVTANHKGFFTFKLCSNNNTAQDPTQQCFDKTVLKVVPSGEDRYYLTTFNTGVFTLKLRLPSNIWCDQCILQWTYTAGNNWGSCEADRGAGLGCGPQENFRACADIAIAGRPSKSAPFELNPKKSKLPYPGIPDPPVKLAPMFEEVPLPSWPNSAQTPPTLSDNHPRTSSDDYFVMDDMPEYFDDLPSSIINHFRTSTPSPYYETSTRPAYDSTPSTCQDGDFFSPCNPHLPSFSIKELSRLSMRGFKTSPKVSITPKGPSNLKPPSGRVPYPSYRPEYKGTDTKFEPLPFSPRQYVPSSTMRPATVQTDKPAINSAPDIRTYRPKYKLPITTSSKPPVTRRPDVTMLKHNLTQIRSKIRNLDRITKPPRKKYSLTNLKPLKDLLGQKPRDMSWESWYQQLRTSGVRRYPNNPINHQLPVTSPPATNPTPTTTTIQPTHPEDYFTIKDRALGSSSNFSPSSFLSLVIMSAGIIFFH